MFKLPWISETVMSLCDLIEIVIIEVFVSGKKQISRFREENQQLKSWDKTKFLPSEDSITIIHSKLIEKNFDVLFEQAFKSTIFCGIDYISNCLLLSKWKTWFQIPNEASFPNWKSFKYRYATSYL